MSNSVGNVHRGFDMLLYSRISNFFKVKGTIQCFNVNENLLLLGIEYQQFQVCHQTRTRLMLFRCSRITVHPENSTANPLHCETHSEDFRTNLRNIYVPHCNWIEAVDYSAISNIPLTKLTYSLQ